MFQLTSSFVLSYIWSQVTLLSFFLKRNICQSQLFLNFPTCNFFLWLNFKFKLGRTCAFPIIGQTRISFKWKPFTHLSLLFISLTFPFSQISTAISYLFHDNYFCFFKCRIFLKVHTFSLLVLEYTSNFALKGSVISIFSLYDLRSISF